MAGAFQFLRSNDLIWSRMIKAYLLGEHEHPNDLMAWNADATRMPARMHSEYLRSCSCATNWPRGVSTSSDGRSRSATSARRISRSGTETDHIAPWRSVYKIHRLYDSDITFVLTAGGHNAGVVSPPGHPSRHCAMLRRDAGRHYLGPEEWLACAELMRARGGRPGPIGWTRIPRAVPAHVRWARPVFPALEPAPGSYVKQH